MKYSHLILIAFVILLGACRKDRTCNCTVTTEGTTTIHNQTPGMSITIAPLPPIQVIQAQDTTITTALNSSKEETKTFKKVKPRTAKYNCVSYDEPISETTVQTIPGTATITTTQTGKRSYSCSLQ